MHPLVESGHPRIDVPGHNSPGNECVGAPGHPLGPGVSAKLTSYWPQLFLPQTELRCFSFCQSGSGIAYLCWPRMTNEYWLNLALPRDYDATRARANKPSHLPASFLQSNARAASPLFCWTPPKEHEQKKQNEQPPDQDLFLVNSGSPAPQNSLLYHEACIP